MQTRAKKILTQRSVETAKPKAKRYGKPDGLIPGMQLIVQPSGAKSYVLFARLKGKQINVRLGPAGVLTLAQARDLARSQLGLVARRQGSARGQEGRPGGTGGYPVNDLRGGGRDVHRPLRQAA